MKSCVKKKNVQLPQLSEQQYHLKSNKSTNKSRENSNNFKNSFNNLPKIFKRTYQQTPQSEFNNSNSSSCKASNKFLTIQKINNNNQSLLSIDSSVDLNENIQDSKELQQDYNYYSETALNEYYQTTLKRLNIKSVKNRKPKVLMGISLQDGTTQSNKRSITSQRRHVNNDFSIFVIRLQDFIPDKQNSSLSHISEKTSLSIFNNSNGTSKRGTQNQRYSFLKAQSEQKNKKDSSFLKAIKSSLSKQQKENQNVVRSRQKLDSIMQQKVEAQPSQSEESLESLSSFVKNHSSKQNSDEEYDIWDNQEMKMRGFDQEEFNKLNQTQQFLLLYKMRYGMFPTQRECISNKEVVKMAQQITSNNMKLHLKYFGNPQKLKFKDETDYSQPISLDNDFNYQRFQQLYEQTSRGKFTHKQ